MSSSDRLTRGFYTRDVLEVAPALIGKELVICRGKNTHERFLITEAEAYRGADDKACHASKGRTRRTEVMYHQGGNVYVYFVYGMYWMFNIVAGEENYPQAVLIRGIAGYDGPGKLTRALGIDGSFYGEDLTVSDRLWVADNKTSFKVKRGPRVGIDYAGDPWKGKPWRYIIQK